MQAKPGFTLIRCFLVVKGQGTDIRKVKGRGVKKYTYPYVKMCMQSSQRKKKYMGQGEKRKKKHAHIANEKKNLHSIRNRNSPRPLRFSNGPWILPCRLATSRPLGEQSEPCLAAKLPTASHEVARGRLVLLFLTLFCLGGSGKNYESSA